MISCHNLGQRCAGRNYGDRRCCTPDNPCDYGEGDCDGPLDGGPNDGHAGCKGDLICGSNNCKKFGEFYHEKVYKKNYSVAHRITLSCFDPISMIFLTLVSKYRGVTCNTFR